MESMIYEQQAHEQGFARVCGVDEAGAGPLMGPLYAAAVILPEQFDLPGLNDSKKLTEKKREALFPLIQQQAVAWAVASVSAREIDETDILSARMRAMQLAIDGLAVRPELALIDGNRDHGRTAAIVTPHSASWTAMRCRPLSPPRLFWPRSAGIGTSAMYWTSSIRNINLQGTRATEPSCTTRCWIGTASARSTASAF